MEENLKAVYEATLACWNLYKTTMQKLENGANYTQTMAQMATESMKIGPLAGVYVALAEDYWREGE